MQVLDGVAGQILALKGDTLLGLDTNYTNPPDLAWPLTFGNLAASTLLPLRYPNYTAEVTIPHALRDLLTTLHTLRLTWWPDHDQATWELSQHSFPEVSIGYSGCS